MRRSLFVVLAAVTFAGNAAAETSEDACTYSLSPHDVNVAAAGGSPTVIVTTPAGCPVNATSFQPWVQVIGIAPNGGVTNVVLTVNANQGPPRGTSIRIADRLFLISQGAALFCPGYENTRVLTMNWQNPVRLFTNNADGLGPNDALVIMFTTGNVSSPDNHLASISAAEYNSTPSTREAVLSASPCDWSPQTWPGAMTSGTSVTVPFAIGSGANFGYYPIVPLNTTYYFNIRNVPNPSCATGGANTCNMAIDLSKPPGT